LLLERSAIPSKKYSIKKYRRMTALTVPRLTQANLPSLLSTIDTFLFDCDGVLWNGGTPIPRAGEAIEALQRAGKRCFFVTNNSTKTRSKYVEVLAKSGIVAPASSVLSSAFAAGEWLRLRQYRRVYLIGEQGLADELHDVAGVSCEGLDDWAIPFSLGTEPPPLDPAVDAVVCGFDGRFCYYKLMRAAAYIRAGRPFLATNRDATYPNNTGPIPGGGCMVAALVTGVQREPDEVAGKPSPGLAALVASATGLVPERTCMVGDRLDTDIRFGNAANYAATILVLTGVTRRDQLAGLSPCAEEHPSFILDSVGDLAEWMHESATSAA
jgi:phosphoglycolate/pyridoxal phosphate phosphatase family enzyme